MTAPLLFRWEGDGFSPANAYVQKRADAVYIVGQIYRIVEQQDRSPKSHRFYFAAIKDGWLNLPEAMAERFPTPEHLRKYALIKSGFCDSHSLVCSSAAEARKVAAFMAPVDEFAVITCEAATVTRYTAQSQAYRAMSKKRFRESADAVLDVIAAMCAVSREDLERNAERAA